MSPEAVEVRLPSGAVLRVPPAVAARIQAAARPEHRHDSDRCRQCGHYLSDRERTRRTHPGACDQCRSEAIASGAA